MNESKYRPPDPYVTLNKDSIVSAFIARGDSGDVKHMLITVAFQDREKEKET